MRDSVPSARYSPVCNVLHQWKTSLIPTYRVYRLYDTLLVLIVFRVGFKLAILLCGCKYMYILVFLLFGINVVSSVGKIRSGRLLSLSCDQIEKIER